MTKKLSSFDKNMRCALRDRISYLEYYPDRAEAGELEGVRQIQRRFLVDAGQFDMLEMAEAVGLSEAARRGLFLRYLTGRMDGHSRAP